VRRALLLDLDGTLCDSLEGLRGAYRAFLSRFGVAGNEAEFAGLNGPPLRVIVERLIETHSIEGEAEALHADYLALVAQAHMDAPPAEGASQALVEARAKGWSTAVVTSASRADAEAWLDRTGLRTLVDTVVGGDCVARGKPGPDPYLEAARRLGCAPEDCVAVEDSAQGAAAALAAGTPTLLLGDHAAPAVLTHRLLLGRIARLADIAAYLGD